MNSLRKLSLKSTGPAANRIFAVKFPLKTFLVGSQLSRTSMPHVHGDKRELRSTSQELRSTGEEL